MKLQIKRSNVLEEGEAKAPALEQMEYGELAVNYNSTDPVIFIRDSNDNIIRLTNIRPIGDGAINVDAGTGLIASGQNATANQLGSTTRTLQIDSSWVADFVNTNGNGGINVNAGPGLEASGSNATANQSGDTHKSIECKDQPERWTWKLQVQALVLCRSLTAESQLIATVLLQSRIQTAVSQSTVLASLR